MLSSPLYCSLAFKDTQIGEKELSPCLTGEVNPWQAILTALPDLGSGSHKIKPIWRALAVFRKQRGFYCPHLLPPLLSYPRNKRKGGVVLFPAPWYLALSEEQRQQYISTLLEKTKSLYKALHFTENHLPQTQRNLTLQAVCILFFHIHTYMYIHIYICVWAHAWVYIVCDFFFCMVCSHYFTKLTFSRKKKPKDLCYHYFLI